MATMQIERYSLALSRVAGFQLILPERELPPQFIQGNPHYQRPTKTLILLHGFSGTTTDWPHHNPVQEWSMKYNLALCFPNGDLSFYLDRPATGAKYCTYVGEELPRYLHATFGLSAAREDMLIGGNSMGGFGALHTALSFPETFGGVIALSSALIGDMLAHLTPDSGNEHKMANYEYYVETFGDPAKFEGSDGDLKELVRRILAAGKPMPRIFQACGAQDFLIEPNRAFHAFLGSQGVESEYREGDGIHDWAYWTPKATEALDFFLQK